MASSGTLQIKNNSQWYIAFWVPYDDWWNCCDEPTRGSVVRVPPRGESYGITFVRTEGHGCSGKQGQFTIIPSLPTIEAQGQQFWFDSDGALEFHGPSPNYVSQLEQVPGGVFVWTVTPPS